MQTLLLLAGRRLGRKAKRVSTGGHFREDAIRKQFCASLAHPRFHATKTQSGHGFNDPG
jgi:hypothetical protein